MGLAISYYWNKFYILLGRHITQGLLTYQKAISPSNTAIIFIKKHLQLLLTLYFHYNFQLREELSDQLVLDLHMRDGGGMLIKSQYFKQITSYLPRVLIPLQNDFASKMKKASSTTRLNLPLIHSSKSSTTTLHTHAHADPTDAEQVSQLQKWTCQKDPKSKRSKVVAAVYRESIGRRMKQRQLTENSLMMEGRLFLMRLESELKKAHDINYQAIHKNIEFCSGIYENAYGCLLREIAKLQIALRNRLEEIEECLRGQRMQHIQSMERLDDKENYRTQIPAIHKAIEEREAELQPVCALIDDLETARKTVLRRCLAHGYDVRQEGLLWVVRELGGQVSHEDFPKFLNEKEIEYLLGRYRSEQAASVRTEKQTLLGVAPEKSKGEILDIIITRKKKRDFTMAHEAAMLEQLKAKQTMELNSQRHQLISKEVLRMAKEQLGVTKATRYELVYRETVRKLNKFCSDQIHNKQRVSNSHEQRRVSSSTLKLLSCFDAKVEDYIKEITHPQQPQPQQEVALDDVLRELRYEGYQMGEKTSRSPVSVVACLVGWKKAKKLIENELNSIL